MTPRKRYGHGPASPTSALAVLETFFNGEVLWRAWPLLWEGSS